MPHSLDSFLCCSWLECGFLIITSKEFANQARDYLLPCPDIAFASGGGRPADYVTISELSMRLLSMFRIPIWSEAKGMWVPSDIPLLLALVCGFYTLHSARNWLVSLAALIGFDAGLRSFAGRWKALEDGCFIDV